MIDLIKQNKVILIVLLIVVAAGAWYIFAGSSGTAALTESSPAGESPAEKALLDSLLTLQAIKLEGQIFQDQAFMSLKDFSTQIVQEPVGRTNPFAPLSGVGQTAGAAAAGTQDTQKTTGQPRTFLNSR